MKNELKCKSKRGRHLKITKKISVFILACVLAIGVCPYSAFATDPQNSEYLENSLLNDLNFIAKADITKKVINGTYVYEFVKKDKTTMTRSNEQKFTSSVAQIIASSEEETVQVEQNIQRARQQSLMRNGGGGSKNEYEWFLGSSLYLELTVDYTSKVVGQTTYYRMDKITATRSVNSGTIITSSNLNFGVQGVSEAGKPVYEEKNYDITFSANPYSTTTPSSWEYAAQGNMMGAGLVVGAKRPGGNAALYPLSVPVF